MLGREREVRATEILLAYQVQQVQHGQVQQVQGQQLQQVHQGRCSIFVNNNKCSKDNEIEWSKIKCSKDSVTKCSESSISVKYFKWGHPVRTFKASTGQSDGKNKAKTACAFVVAGFLCFGFGSGNGSFSAGKLAWA